MHVKIDLDQYIDELELVNEEKSMARYRTIIDEINNEMQFDVRNKKAKNDYDNFDAIMQIYVAKYSEYPKLLEMFEEHALKNGFDPKQYLDYAVKKITENASNVETYITGLLDSGIIDDVYVDDDGVWTIKSKIVNFSFEPADIYYKDYTEIIDYIYNTEGRRTGCHQNAEFLLTFFKDGEAITAKLKNLVGIDFYHSYYRNNGKICDLNTNVVMMEDDYNRLYQPEIISVLTFEKFKQKIEEVKLKATSTLMPLLEIAAYEEYKKTIKE